MYNGLTISSAIICAEADNSGSLYVLPYVLGLSTTPLPTAGALARPPVDPQ